MRDLIEHLEDPTSLMKETNRILKEGGLLVINTGNIDSLFARIMGRRWMNFVRCHTYYFSPRTIRLLLEKTHFKTIQKKPHSRIFRLRQVVKWLKTYPLLYPAVKRIFGETPIGALKIARNLGNDMTVYAIKKKFG